MQAFGVALLVRQDNIAKAKSDNDAEISRMKAAMVSSGKYDLKAVYFPEDSDGVDQDLDDPENQYDFADVEYESPQDMTDDDRNFLDELLADDQMMVQMEPPGLDQEWT